jgi:spore coat polysaccharide biosynthesis protein SpsF|tara:strand:- start:223 stop:912 length:690 start_codon:yes stop_codon:yes gene_type:complete
MSKYKIPCIVQARMGSSRLPGKSLKLFNSIPAIEITLKRLSNANNISEVILATSTNDENTILANYCSKLGYRVYRGSEKNLVLRFIQTIDHFNIDTKNFIRATADNVFMCWHEIDRLVEHGLVNKFDYVNYKNPAYPDRNNDFSGEFVNVQKLRDVLNITNNNFDLEHVYPYFINNDKKFMIDTIDVPSTLHSNIKLDMDTEEDYQAIAKMCEKVDDLFNTETSNILNN